MGNEYIALIDVVPEEVETDFEELVEKLKKVLPDTCVIERYEIMPVAFGLKKARLRIRYPEELDTEKLEELLGQVDGLQGIETLAISKP